MGTEFWEWGFEFDFVPIVLKNRRDVKNSERGGMKGLAVGDYMEVNH